MLGRRAEGMAFNLRNQIQLPSCHFRNPVLSSVQNCETRDTNYVDIGAPGPSVGDLLVFNDGLFDPVSHRRVGAESGVCTIVDVLAGPQTSCVGAAKLTAGQISFQGSATDAPVKPLAVVGGSGSYQGASGEFTLIENGDGTNSGKDDGTGTLTITLRREHG